jgi:FkbM family methyltransferase
MPMDPGVKAKLTRAAELTAGGELKQAIDLLESTVQEHASVDAYAALGQALLRAGITSAGRRALAQALLLDPTNRKTAYALAKQVRKLELGLRQSIGDVLAFVKDLGFTPATIIDVGVAAGTPGLYDYYPDANILLIDPVAENEEFMRRICDRYPKARYALTAAGSREGSITMSVDPAFSGSRIVDLLGRNSGGRDQTATMTPIDKLVKEFGLSGPYILKLDTEGSELDVLAGATQTLRETELIIMEQRVAPSSKAPVLRDALNVLHEYGFATYDMIGRNCNDADFTLKQIDLVAVKIDGFFRTENGNRRFKRPDPSKGEAVIARKLAEREQARDRLSQVKKGT